jgi:hypothetical protein
LKNGRSTSKKILDNKKWLKYGASGISRKKTRQRPDKYPRTNEVVSTWTLVALNNSHIPRGPIIQQKALSFAKNFPGEADFKTSEGWLESFNGKHGIRSYVQYGEANSAPPDNLPKERAKLQGLLPQYNRDDIYSVDESGLFFIWSA